MRSFRTFLKSKMIPLAIAAVVVGGGVTALSVAASAAPTKSSTTPSAKGNSKPNSKPKAKGSPCTAIGHVIKNKRDAGVRRTWPRGANWRASATAKGSVITLQHEERVHNSVSATVGVTNSVVSAALGFNVEFQKAVWVGFSYTTPKAGRYELRVTPVYRDYRFDIHAKAGEIVYSGEWPVCVPTGKAGAKIGSGRASRYERLESGVFRQSSPGKWVRVK